ncbi:hypothetical protein TGGT1_214070 [Toxoplasma gondii GT1]|nr:hypothetical protein TGGT1_214070 [Toxoplasma gondii GT1]KAF4640120.1 hypothetical protein TGRH88_040450 [Toxoplasma gondii]KYF42991.1 hypothetical protein TGARI_214070 [Toxoplasma gondii ARI]
MLVVAALVDLVGNGQRDQQLAVAGRHLEGPQVAQDTSTASVFEQRKDTGHETGSFGALTETGAPSPALCLIGFSLRLTAVCRLADSRSRATRVWLVKVAGVSEKAAYLL